MPFASRALLTLLPLAASAAKAASAASAASVEQQHSGGFGSGHHSCPCLRVSEDHGVVVVGEKSLWDLNYTYGKLDYGLTYGLLCLDHDNFKPPSCDNATTAPSWCADMWCYVDPDVCLLKNSMSTYKPGVRLAFSYDSCRPTINAELTETGTKNFLWLLLIAVGPAVVVVLTTASVVLMRRIRQSGGCARICPSTQVTAGGGAAKQRSSGRHASVLASTNGIIAFTIERLELALAADRAVALSVLSITMSISWLFIFLGLGPFIMFDFDVIPNEAVLPPSMGNRLYYRALFPPGFCMLILSIRPGAFISPYLAIISPYLATISARLAIISPHLDDIISPHLCTSPFHDLR